MFALLVVLLHNHQVCLACIFVCLWYLILSLGVQSNAEVSGFRSSVDLDSRVSSQSNGSVTMGGKLLYICICKNVSY